MAANTTFTNSWHKAGAAYTVEFVTKNVANYTPLLATANTTSSPPGIAFIFNNAPQFAYVVNNDTTTTLNASFGISSAATGGAAHIILSINGASSFLMVNGAVVTTFNATPASPTASAANHAPYIFGGAGHTAPSGRLHAFMLRNAAIGSAQGAVLFANIRNRWGI